MKESRRVGYGVEKQRSVIEQLHQSAAELFLRTDTESLCQNGAIDAV